MQVKLLPHEGELYVLVQRQDRIPKERALRRRQLNPKTEIQNHGAHGRHGRRLIGVRQDLKPVIPFCEPTVGFYSVSSASSVVSVSEIRLKALWAHLQELQTQRPSYEALLLKLGAAKALAGRVWSLVTVTLPAQPPPQNTAKRAREM